MEKLSFNIESFEGPLDLLLSLIKKNEMSIFDIQIHVIFRQYMEYLEMMEKLDIDIAGEFITMAAELMLIKSQMLLPRTAEEESPVKRLQIAVMEYAKARRRVSQGKMAGKLRCRVPRARGAGERASASLRDKGA